MAPNTLLTPNMITREALRVLENNLVLTRNVNRQYDSSFGNDGAKIGDTLRIRKPDRVLVTSGPAINVQPIQQQSVSLAIANQLHVDMAFNSSELALSIDDFSELYIKPRASQLAASVDFAVAAGVIAKIGNLVGTPGTTPSTTQVLLAAQQKLNENAAGMSPRFAVVNPAANAALVEGMKGLFNPTGTISKQFREGMMGTGVLGYDEIAMSQSITNLTTGTRTAGTVTTTAVNGATTLALTITGTQTVKAGDVFTIANVNAVNPQTRQSTGSLYQFVALADATAVAGAITVSVYPVYDAAQALATVDVLPQAGAVVTWVGGAGVSYPQNIVAHRDAIAFVTADLPMPKGMDMASRVQHNGMSLRFVRGFDITNDRFVSRLDILFGFEVIRPEMACRLIG